MSRSEMAVLLPSLPTALQVMIAEIEDGKVDESKRTCTCSACVPIGLAGRFSWRLAGGTFFLWRCVGTQDLFYKGSRGAIPPPTSESFSACFGVCRPILLGSNGRRADGILRLACNGDSTNSAGACGERYGGIRPDWPVSDHFNRQIWKQHRSGEGGREH